MTMNWEEHWKSKKRLTSFGADPTPVSTPSSTTHGVVTPDVVLAYYKAWTPYVTGVAKAAQQCADLWNLAATGGTPNPPINTAQFKLAPDSKELALFASVQQSNATGIMQDWNIHANTPDAQIVLLAADFLRDYQQTVIRASNYADDVHRDCPAIVLPTPPSFVDQVQIISRIEGLNILANGVLQLFTIGATGVLQSAGAVASAVGQAATGTLKVLPWALGTAAVILGLVAFEKIEGFEKALK